MEFLYSACTVRTLRLKYAELNFIVECFSRVVSSPALCLGGPRFKCWPGVQAVLTIFLGFSQFLQPNVGVLP